MRATVVATLTSPPSPEGGEFAQLSGVADFLEVRADLVGDLDPAVLRARFAGGLLYTLRSREEGGKGENDPSRRAARLGSAAAAGYDLVDLEGARDRGDALLARVAPERRLVSWHGPPTGVEELKRRFAGLAEVPARLYKLVPAAVQPGDELAPLALLHSLGRRDVAAFAGGASGSWTRLVAARLGAPWVYASVGPGAAAPGQPSVAALVADHGLPDLPPVEWICGVVGHPVAHSLSPRLHNGGYRALALRGLYLAFDTPAFGDFWLDVVETAVLADAGMPLVGLSVTAPHKRVALAVAGAASPLAERIGAANTLVRREGVWEAEATDPAGLAGPLAARGIAVAGRPAAVVGAGGAGRAAAFALVRLGARVTLVNRNVDRGRWAAERVAVPFVALAEFRPEEFEIVVHATSLGREAGELPFDPDRLAPGAVVVDLVYGEEPTQLLAAAARRGAVAIDGREVLLDQALAQFRLMTGRELPRDLGARLLGV